MKDSIVVHKVGLSNKYEKVDIWSKPYGSACASAVYHKIGNNDNKKLIKQTMSLVEAKEYLQKNNIQDVDILKMDCEGCEYEILTQELIEFIDPEVVLLEYHKGYQELVDVLESLQFKCDVETKHNNVGLIYAKK